jgi:hypothetical protein
LNIEKLNDWIQAIGVFGVIVSLLFVGYQLRQDREIAIYEGAAANVTSSSEWAALVTKNVDVWRRGCVGEQLTDDERVVFFHLIQLLVDRKVYEYARGELIQDERIQTINVNFMAANMHRYPGVNEALNKYSNWVYPSVVPQLLESDSVSSRFFQLVQKRASEMAQLEPNPQFDAGFCGA